ncbi:hypothetical protein [Massilia putida]|uniref:hypothetical protein n=1 Tax=Massilia putida TaxID=1141883 RepID=UPI0012EB9209|nr:hypothetical protein [Massilia putida]
MRGLTFDELFAMLSAVTLSAADLARLREWLAGIAHRAECIALRAGAVGRPCPQFGCATSANTAKKKPPAHRCVRR